MSPGNRLTIPSNNSRYGSSNHRNNHKSNKFRSQSSDNMDRWKAEMGRVREEKGGRKRIKEETVRRKEIQVRENVGKPRNTVFFPMICGSGGSKNRLAKTVNAHDGAKRGNQTVLNHFKSIIYLKSPFAMLGGGGWSTNYTLINQEVCRSSRIASPVSTKSFSCVCSTGSCTHSNKGAWFHKTFLDWLTRFSSGSLCQQGWDPGECLLYPWSFSSTPLSRFQRLWLQGIAVKKQPVCTMGHGQGHPSPGPGIQSAARAAHEAKTIEIHKKYPRKVIIKYKLI